ncbi:hypothetical protein KIW84_063589 [Lathyrus oleraceus]|uniref:Small nuclear ribonucleoprotein E n=1 Tax=Pisum sativum TaxID=3888 RepID=A0A9D5A710_PEA|nr:hypothetical protein KIW84_063589 [Pisum sativum]
MFSFNILEKFAYTRPSGKELGPDVCTCDRTNNVTFTIKTAYVAFTSTDNNIQQDRLKKMQNLNVPERIRIFIWQKVRIQIWLFEQKDLRIEGRIIGFDEYMNLVLDDAEEANVKKKSRKTLGRILLEGDNITLMMNTGK